MPSPHEPNHRIVVSFPRGQWDFAAQTERCRRLARLEELPSLLSRALPALRVLALGDIMPIEGLLGEYTGKHEGYPTSNKRVYGWS